MPKINNAKTIRVVVIGLMIDILAFTIILPLLPRLLDSYYSNPKKSILFSILLNYLGQLRNYISIGGVVKPDMDILLLGGFVGSLFSFLQFLSSPIIGKLSDQYGRRNVLLFSMVHLLNCIYMYVDWKRIVNACLDILCGFI